MFPAFGAVECPLLMSGTVPLPGDGRFVGVMLPEWEGGGLLLGRLETRFRVCGPGWETWCGGGPPVLDDGPTFRLVWCRLLALLGPPPFEPLLPPCGSRGGLIGSLFIFTGSGDVDGGGVLLDTAR